MSAIDKDAFWDKFHSSFNLKEDEWIEKLKNSYGCDHRLIDSMLKRAYFDGYIKARAELRDLMRDVFKIEEVIK